MATFGYNRTALRGTQPKLHPVFEDRIISRRADVVCPPRSCDLIPLVYFLWGAVKNKCCTDKPETIDALNDIIRKAIGEIQLHTIEIVLKNWTEKISTKSYSILR